MPPLPPDAGVNAASTLVAEQFDAADVTRAKSAKCRDNSAAFRTARDAEATFVPPTFSIKELRDAVPSHCFQRNAWRSSRYVLEDIVLIALFATSIWWVDGWLDAQAAPLWTKVVAWAIYAFVQGVPGTGLWVIAHECGHQAYAESSTVNFTVGYVLHTLLLVPFHSWRITHATHHAHTSHMTKDQVFVPKTRKQIGLKPLADPATADDAGHQHDDSPLKESPLYSCLSVLVMLTLGWPLYLFFNLSGQKYGRWTSHFNPNAAMFKPEQRAQVNASTMGVVAMLGALVWSGMQWGWKVPVLYYLLPYLWVNFWLITITFLQHTDPVLPHYRAPEWDFVRGALCTVDRDFGWVLNKRLHHIHDTHVAHHLFSRMPHYHAEEATRHLREKLGPQYYVYDRTPIWTALYRTWRQCRYVEDTGDVLFFRGVDEDPYAIGKKQS
ncbi:fatty acid desaturase-domain-containing protein [Syncephalis pseudoplumigaleata]|uniref:Fatty acid desaturase-domain-containing protein n=1 Tax=Syncephalis pseudoplumigaleata TaxID=1712513 RepID=A0A4P9YXE9_9FUNG|nr:fatty acid desaturase-domain-containing protein [Syncephalis pseudoplumigaleata]|eukprot:RKP24202.1 fatty acid desaturase-domain-containing protein [Syncephalis pseudoplumigaleata]